MKYALKTVTALLFCLLLLAGCGKKENDPAGTYLSEKGVLILNSDGTWTDGGSEQFQWTQTFEGLLLRKSKPEKCHIEVYLDDNLSIPERKSKGAHINHVENVASSTYLSEDGSFRVELEVLDRATETEKALDAIPGVVETRVCVEKWGTQELLFRVTEEGLVSPEGILYKKQ